MSEWHVSNYRKAELLKRWYVLFSDDLQELKKNVKNEFSQTNNQIKQISKTLGNKLLMTCNFKVKFCTV